MDALKGFLKSLNQIARLFLSLALSFGVAGCSSYGQIENLIEPSVEGVLQQKVYFDVTALNVTEGSAAYVSIQMTEKLATDTKIELKIQGESAAIEAIPATVIILAGKLSVPLKIQTIEDSVYLGPRSVRLVLSSSTEGLVAEPNSLDIKISDNDSATATFAVAAQSVSESVGLVTVITQLDAPATNQVTIPLVISGSANEGAAADFTISPASITIAPGQSTSVQVVTINNDSSVESAETVVLNMGTPTNASLGAITSQTITITDDDLGSFSISGVTGTTDGVQDAFLVDGTEPTINWGASVGATSYDVTVFANDGTTVVCPMQVSVGTSYVFTGCALTLGTTYKAQVIAKAPGLSLAASNSLYSFYVNQAPVVGNDGPIRVMKGSSATSYSVLATDSNQGLSGDSDPDAGDTITITAITQGTAGGVVTNPSATTVTYAPPSASFTGVDSFTYTVTDSRGATAVATVTMHVMSTYTWTGKVSSTWASNGNWCGTITNNACVGSTGFPSASGTSTHLAVFDGTCTATGHSCDASIAAAAQAYAVYLNTGYTGTLSQAAGAGNTLSIGAGGFAQSAGTFTGGSGNVTITGGFYTQTGGTSSWGTGILYLNMTQGASTTAMSVGASATMGFQTGGTFRLSGRGACGGPNYTMSLNATQTFENVTFDGNTTGCGASRFVLGGSGIMTVNGAFTQGAGITMSSGLYKLYGNLSLNGSGANGGTLEMLGSSDTTYAFTGGAGAKLLVNKPAGFRVSAAGGTTSLTLAALEVNSGEFHFPTGTLSLRNGPSFTTLLKIVTGTTVVVPTNSATSFGLAGDCGGVGYFVDVDTAFTFENMDIYGFNNGCSYGSFNIAAGDTINVAKTLNVNSTAAGYLLSSNIHAQGDVVSSGYLPYSGAGIILNGAGTQNITQNASSHFPSITINKPVGVITNFLTDVAVSRSDADFTLQSGTLNLNGFALSVSDGSGTNNILTFGAGTEVNLGGTGTYTGEQVFTAGSTINP